MHFWDDVTKFGGDALDSIGEGADVFLKTYAEKKAEEITADPKTTNQVAPLVNTDGSNVGASGGYMPSVSNNTLLIAGAVLFAGAAAFVLIRGK